MLNYIIRRLLLIVPVLVGISIVTFALLRLIPGDPATVMWGEHATADSIAEFRERTGLNKPIYVQYGIYLRDLLRFDFTPQARAGLERFLAECQRAELLGDARRATQAAPGSAAPPAPLRFFDW